MKTATRLQLLAVTGLVTFSCSSGYDLHTEPDKYGNPGRNMVRTYSQEFLVLEKDYFAALNAFYSFTREHTFDEFRFGRCFGRVMNVLFKQSELPCIAVYTSKGTPVKRHATFTITAKKFFRHDGRDYLGYRIDLYDLDGLEASPTMSEKFATQVEPGLLDLSSHAPKPTEVPRGVTSPPPA